MSLKSIKSTAFLIALALALVFVFPSRGQAQPTVECDGRVYFSIGGSSSQYSTVGLTFLDANQPTFPLVLIDPPGVGSGVNYNSIGINLLDGYIYGAAGDSIYRIGGDGSLVEIADGITEDTSSTVYNAGFIGDVDQNGYYYVSSGGNFLRVVDVANPIEWTKINVRNSSGSLVRTQGADFAFSPVTNDIFVKRSSGTNVGIIDIPDNITLGNGPVDAVMTTFNVGSGPTGAAGGSWFDANGDWFNFFNNKGGFGQVWKYSVDYTTSPPSITNVEVLNGSAAAMSRNDAASCGYAPLFQKSVAQRNPQGGDALDFTFRIGNQRFIALNDLEIYDDSLVTEIPGGSWGAITACSATLTADGSPPSFDPCPAILNQTVSGAGQALDLQNIDMPPRSQLLLTVTFNSPGTAGGTKCNQATLSGLPVIHRETMLSDDPITPNGPDATCVDFGDPPFLDCEVLNEMPTYVPGTNEMFAFVVENSGAGAAANISVFDDFAPPNGASGNGQLQCSTASDCRTDTDFSDYSNSNCTPATVSDSDDYSSSNINLAGGTPSNPTRYCVAVPISFDSAMTVDYPIDPQFTFSGTTAPCDLQTATVSIEGDLRVTKTSDGDSFTPGQPTEYTITIFNNGPSDIAGAELTDNAIVSVGTIENFSTGCSCTSGGANTCRNSLNPVATDIGSSIQVTDTVTIPSKCTATISYDLTVTQ